VFNLLLAASSVIQPLAFRALFDDFLPAEDYQLAVLLIVAITIMPIVFALLNAVTVYLNTHLGDALTRILRKELFSHILKARNEYFQKIGKGELINRITQQVGILCDVLIVNTFLKIVTNLFMLVAILAVMFFLDIHLSLISIILFPLFILIVRKMKKKIGHLEANYFSSLDKAINYLQDLFSNIKPVHIFNGYNRERNKWDQWLDENWEVRRKIIAFRETYTGVLAEVVIATTTGILYTFSIFLLIDGRLTIGTLLAFIMILPRMYSIFRELSLASIDWERMKAIIKNLNEILSIAQITEGTVLADKNEDYQLQFRGVNFQYADKKVLA